MLNSHPCETFTFIEDPQYGLNSPTPVKLLHSLRIFIDYDADDDDDDDDEISRNEGVFFCHPSAHMDDTENLTRHCPCAVKTHSPGQHIRPGRTITL